MNARVVVPLTDLVRVLLRDVDGLTFSELMDLALDAGVSLDRGELSSCLAKMLKREEISRQQVPRRGPVARAVVWRYSWRNQ